MTIKCHHCISEQSLGHLPIRPFPREVTFRETIVGDINVTDKCYVTNKCEQITVKRFKCRVMVTLVTYGVYVYNTKRTRFAQRKSIVCGKE